MSSKFSSYTVQTSSNLSLLPIPPTRPTFPSYPSPLHSNFSSNHTLLCSLIGQRFKDNLKKVEKVLEDRTIDNTMAGAKKRYFMHT